MNKNYIEAYFLCILNFAKDVKMKNILKDFIEQSVNFKK